MLYLLAEWLGFEGLFNLVRYQTFRSGATMLTALALGLVIGPKFISMLRVRQGKGQPIREDGPQTHQAKVGTPTMGGLMILTSLTISMLLWMDPVNPPGSSSGRRRTSTCRSCKTGTFRSGRRTTCSPPP